MTGAAAPVAGAGGMYSVNSLVERGFNLSEPCEAGTVLSFKDTIRSDSLPLVQHLLTDGADIGKKSHRKTTATSIAVKTRKFEFVKPLLECGADPLVEDNFRNK